MFEKDILPLLQKQNGFGDEITFVSPGREAGTRHQLVGEQGERGRYSRETYPQVLKSLARVVEGTPQVRGYEVAVSTLHKTAATR